MLSSITQLSIQVYSEIMSGPVDNLLKEKVYNNYKNLDTMIAAMHVAAVHYLPISLDVEYLQNSSHGSAFQKWHKFTRKDIEIMNVAMQKYMMSLLEIGYKYDDDCLEGDIILSRFVSNKYLYGYFRDHYVGACMSDDGHNIRYSPLQILLTEEEFYSHRYETIKIETHNERIDVSKKMIENIESLRVLRDQIRFFICDNFTIVDLV